MTKNSKSTWPTLEDRLKNALSTNEQALKQLKEVYPDAKLPSEEEIKEYEKFLEEFE